VAQRSKRNRAYYIYEDQINELDEVSNENPSRFLRNLLDRVLGEMNE